LIKSNIILVKNTPVITVLQPNDIGPKFYKIINIILISNRTHDSLKMFRKKIEEKKNLTDGLLTRFGRFIISDVDNLRIKLIEETYIRLVIIYLEKIKTIKLLIK
jgi:hypothetical protein